MSEQTIRVGDLVMVNPEILDAGEFYAGRVDSVLHSDTGDVSHVQFTDTRGLRQFYSVNDVTRLADRFELIEYRLSYDENYDGDARGNDLAALLETVRSLRDIVRQGRGTDV